jgi:glycosyltransferase involved in cell wall biosynthesis
MISVVTRVRNRKEHLLESISAWTSEPSVQDVVVVDYGSTEPIEPSILDLSDKIRLCTVYNTPLWKSGKAINIGVQWARCPFILRLDCDINRVRNLKKYVEAKTASNFFSGRMAEEGFKSFFGQCLFSKSQWAAVGGYHEFMVGWGFDDSDFYARLVEHGYRRELFDIDDLGDITHSDVVRSSASLPEYDFIRAEAMKDKSFQMRLNRIISKIVPWDPSFHRAVQFQAASDRHAHVYLDEETRFEREIVRLSTILCAMSWELPYGGDDRRGIFAALTSIKPLNRIKWMKFLVRDIGKSTTPIY